MKVLFPVISSASQYHSIGVTIPYVRSIEFIEDHLPFNEWTWNPLYCTLKHYPLYDSGDTGEAEEFKSISGGLKRIIYFPRLITFKTLIPKISVLGKHTEPQMKNLIQRTILPLTPGGKSSLKNHTYFHKLPFAFSPSPLKAPSNAASTVFFICYFINFL